MTNTTEAALRRRLRTTIATAATAAVALMALGSATPQPEATQPPGSIGVRLLEIPADRADDPRASASIIDHVAPGGRFTRRIGIVSTVDEPVTVDVYGGNGQIQNGIFVPDDDTGLGIADWITVDQAQVTVPSGGTQAVEVAVDVPNNAPSGEYYGYVWVEPPASEAQVAVANRVGIRLYLSVGTGNEPPVDFTIGSLTAARDAEGVPVVTTQLRNTGGRALDIGGELFLSDGPAGLDAGPFAADGTIALAPGEAASMTITLDSELPDGPWLARVVAQSGLLERTAEAEISFPTGAGEEAPPAASETIGGTDEDGNDISERLRGQRRALLPLAALLILLALGALWLMLMWKRRQDEEDEEAQEAAKASARVSGGSDDSG